MQLELKFSAAWWVPLLFILLAVLFSLWIYRRTVPAVSPLLRRVLLGLRYAALALVLLLLFEPVLGLRWTTSRRPTVAVLVDESASMTITDSTSRRSETARRLLSRPWATTLQRSSRLAYFAFADSLRSIPADSVPVLGFRGDGTDLASALVAAQKQLADQNLAAVMVFSDGIANLGENPARVAARFPVPIFAVGIGSPLQARDLIVTQVLTNDLAYADTQVPVELTVTAVGYAGRAARITLEDDAGVLAEQQITLPADNTQLTTKVMFTPRRLGMNKLTAGVATQPGEASTLNNRRSAFVRVLKSKARLWIVSGSPSPDLAFVKRTLEADQNFAVTSFVQKLDGSFYGGSAPILPAEKGEALPDALIFIDFPRRDSDGGVLAALAAGLRSANVPVYWMAGADLDLNRWWSFQASLPLAAKPARGSEMLVSMAPEAPALSHPLVRFAEVPEDNRALWENLPPVFCSVVNVKAAAGAQVLATADAANGSVPLLIAQRGAPARCVALLSYGLWRWSLKLAGLGQSPVAYEHLVMQGVRWLITREDSKTVRFTTNKHLYRGGEPVELTAQIYYEDYRPRTGATATARLRGPGYDREVVLDEVGDGIYRGSPGNLPGGDYELRGRAEHNGQTIGEDTTKFAVEPFSIEYQATAMNETLLRKTAEASNGRYLDADSLEAFAARVTFPVQQLQKRRELDMWGRPSILMLVVLCLAAEWFLRKRWGML